MRETFEVFGQLRVLLIGISRHADCLEIHELVNIQLNDPNKPNGITYMQALYIKFVYFLEFT